MTTATAERRKYEEVWSLPNYRAYSPGEAVLPLFRQQVRPRSKGRLIDIGCGTGRAGLALASDGWDVTLLDHAKNCRDHEAKGLPFVKACVWGRWAGQWDVGYCCDVMEHIPPEKVNATLKRIFTNCGRVFFSICFEPDHFGGEVGHPLHLTVQPFTWWRDRLGEHGTVRNARDLIGMGVFDVAR